MTKMYNVNGNMNEYYGKEEYVNKYIYDPWELPNIEIGRSVCYYPKVKDGHGYMDEGVIDISFVERDCSDEYILVENGTYFVT